MSLYDLDYNAWALEQANVVRRRSANEIDWDNVAEELEGLSKQLEAELYNRYVVLLSHLLKWIYQPQRRGRSWAGSIREQRIRIDRHVRKYPSLKAADDDIFQEAFEAARAAAARETRLPLSTYPDRPPFTREQARDPVWWADAEQPD
jgi:hypothetical protein